MQEFGQQDLTTLRRHNIVIFANRLIFKAQPPITDAALKRIEGHLEGPIPDQLLDLWRVTSGGELCYEGAFRELFYQDSDHYRDLDGWIQHELTTVETSKLAYLPFAGWECWNRFYVKVASEGFGQVWEWCSEARWIPGDEATADCCGKDLLAFFATLAAPSDEEDLNDYLEVLAEYLAPLAENDPGLAERVRAHYLSTRKTD